MNSSSSWNTIYVGNIQSIKDDQLREYFQKFGKIEALYHYCTRAADEWLIDYRFIRFSSDTNMDMFYKSKIDHTICRIILDIHSYEEALREETRLVSDRKICIAHTNTKLNRNDIKKAFSKYGRILNCTCVSSGNGLEYVYIEFESINSVAHVLSNHRGHFVRGTSLAVKQPLRPSKNTAKFEAASTNDGTSTRSSLVSKQSYTQQLNTNVDTAQYSSIAFNQPNTNNEDGLPISQQHLSTSSNIQQSNADTFIDSNTESPVPNSQLQLKDYEREYDLVIQQDLDEVTYQVARFLANQKKSYRKLSKFIFDELKFSSSPSSSAEEDEFDPAVSFTYSKKVSKLQ